MRMEAISREGEILTYFIIGLAGEPPVSTRSSEPCPAAAARRCLTATFLPCAERRE